MRNHTCALQALAPTLPPSEDAAPTPDPALLRTIAELEAKVAQHRAKEKDLLQDMQRLRLALSRAAGRGSALQGYDPAATALAHLWRARDALRLLGVRPTAHGRSFERHA